MTGALMSGALMGVDPTVISTTNAYSWCRVCKRHLFKNYAAIKKNYNLPVIVEILHFFTPACYKLKFSFISCIQ